MLIKIDALLTSTNKIMASGHSLGQVSPDVADALVKISDKQRQLSARR